MKILHTSDWHLGRSDESHSLYSDQIHFIDEICGISEEHNIDVIIIAGDIFDRSVPSAEAVKLYDTAMTKLCIEHGKDVVVIAGNHDSSDRIENCGSLLAKAGLHVIGSVSSEPAVVRYEDADIYMLPWVKESKVKSIYIDEADEIGCLEDAYGILCSKMKELFEPGKKNILVSHSFMTNSETSTSDRAAELGFADQVGVRVFENFDYVALGHIHKPQNVGENARYSGTPMPYSFGKEENQEKSVTIIDTDTMERTIVPLKPLHKRKTLTGTLDEILEGDFSPDILNGYVRVVVTDAYAGFDVTSRISSKFPNLIEVTGKLYENSDASISMTMDDLKKFESDPVEIFRSFCRDTMNDEPDERITDMFKECMKECEEAEE